MSKPSPEDCRHCSLYPCTRTHCNRRLMLVDGIKRMREKSYHAYWRSHERKRMYMEVRRLHTNTN
jgi:hypothetical protein